MVSLPVSASENYCPQCGTQLQRNAGFCAGCGTKRSGELPDTTSPAILNTRILSTSSGDFLIANFGERTGAFVVDQILIFLLLVGGFFGASILPEAGGSLVAISWIAVLLYYPLCEGHVNGATLGKQAFGIKVVDTQTGLSIGLWTGICRTFARIFDLGVIGLIAAAFDPKTQTFHDRLVNTSVIQRVRTEAHPNA